MWAESCTRESIWEALYARRMFALTGDRVALQFSLNGAPMGAVIPASGERRLAIEVAGGGAIDCVDVIRDGELCRRFSQTDMAGAVQGDLVRTKIHLELGWGAKHRSAGWEVEFGIDAGEILNIEPRFRGLEVVSPTEREAQVGESFYRSRVREQGERSVFFETVTQGNATNTTSATQGMCLEVDMPRSGKVYAVMNGVRAEHSLEELMLGARSGSLDHTDAPSWRFGRAPRPEELNWAIDFSDQAKAGAGNYYVRVRQTNDQWAWSSPVFLRE